MTLEKRFIIALKRLDIMNNRACLLALSGGGDSVALTALAARSLRAMPITFYAARVSHGIRSDTEEEAERSLCEKLCGTLGIPFKDLLLPPGEVESIKQGLSCGMEQAARHARHTALEEYRKSIGASCILSGHTADDQLETVLMRLLNGSGPEGLKGISAQSGRWIRPLLSERRSVLRAWLTEQNIVWAEDLSNESGQYRRNRVRSELIPLISDIMPGWEKAALVLAGRSREVQQALRAFHEQAIPVIWKPDGPLEYSAKWSSEAWDAAPDYLKAMTLWDVLDRLDTSGIPDRRISWSCITNARRVFDESGQWSGQGVQLRRNGDECTALTMETTAGEARFVIERADILESQGKWQDAVGPWRVWASFMPMENSRAFSVKSNDWPLILHLSGKGKDSKFDLTGRNGQLIVKQMASELDEIVYIRAC